MEEQDILNKILEIVQKKNPDVKSIFVEDELYGTESRWGLSSMEIAEVLIDIEDEFEVSLDLDVTNMREIMDCICGRC